MNLLLAVVYQYYREEHIKAVSGSRSKEHQTLLLAHALMCEVYDRIDFFAFSSFKNS